MQITSPGLQNIKREGEAWAAQPSDLTYWIQKFLGFLGGATPVGSATFALQHATPQARPATSGSAGTSRSLDALLLLGTLVPLAMGRSGGRAQQEATELMQKVMQEYGVVPEDMMRLFRGASTGYSVDMPIPERAWRSPMERDTWGRWFSSDPGVALPYADEFYRPTGPLWMVDVPREVAERSWLPNQVDEIRDLSPWLTGEYVLPPDYAAQAIQIWEQHNPRGLEMMPGALSAAYKHLFGLPEVLQLEGQLPVGMWKALVDQGRLKLEQGSAQGKPWGGLDYMEMLRGLANRFKFLQE